MLIVLELDERAPQRAMDVEDFGDALALGVHALDAMLSARG